ncbi:MAG: glycosyltransferase [Patescibacteria group bacterium]|jgi:glycosyltransferase involved in cell wall biosynthesis
MFKKNKTILIVAPYGFNDRMANFAEFIIARLLAENSWGVIGLVQHEGEAEEIESICGVKIYRYKNFRQGLNFLLKIFFTEHPAITHVYQQRNNRIGILAAMLAKLTFKPLLFTEYGLLHDHYLVDDRDDPLGKPLKPNGLVFNLKQIFTKSFIKKTASLISNIKNYFFHWALTHANKIIFVSKHNLPIAKSLGLKNYTYLPYILDNARWNKIQDEQKQDKNNLRALNKINDRSFCLFIGQLKLRKGWDVYLESIPLIDKAIMPFFVVITSSAKEPPAYLLKKIEKLGIGNRIVFFGQVSGQILKKIYNSSSIVVVPSRYEGFGLIAVEAFENKKPLIASMVTALDENVVDGYNSLTVPPKNPKKLAEAITQLASDKELQKKLVVGGEETLEKLKSSELKQRWLDFYEELIS